MREHKADVEQRDIGRQPLSEAELDEMIGSRSHLYFLNPKNDMYRSRRMKEKPPSRAEAIKMMAKEPNLIRRPILRKGRQWVFGFDALKFESIFE